MYLKVFVKYISVIYNDFMFRVYNYQPNISTCAKGVGPNYPHLLITKWAK